MTNVRSVKSQAGFSLIELMVVVAIIGILAALAIPSVGKYMAKARQSEAKTQLSSLFTAEQAFYAEYSAYHSMFGAIGYSPEGQLRYEVGFAADGTDANAQNGFNNTVAAPGNVWDTIAYCGTAIAMPNGCMILNGADNKAPAAGNIAAGTAQTGATFVAGAGAVIFNPATGTGAVPDQWTINQNKLLTNTQNGIL